MSLATPLLLVASMALGAPAPSAPMQASFRNAATHTGLDVLEAQGFAPLRGKRVGVITNHTGLTRSGQRGIDVMRKAGVQIVALFSPEHGFAGTEDKGGLGDTVDAATALKVYSLYGQTLRPSPESLQGVDALVFDIMDVGVRFYTYETTMAYGMEAAAKAGIPYFVLDRPNPITGNFVEGPLLGDGNTSFAGYHPGTPARHGMTMGELAKMFNVERKINANLTVVEMKDWRRSDWFDNTNLIWVNPSPNMRSLTAAILYPGVCLIEFAKNISVGRGTDAPFEQIGADFIEGRRLSEYLNARNLPGIRTYPTRFTPTESRFKDVPIEGVRIEVIDRQKIKSVQLGIELACAIEKLYPKQVAWAESRRLIGSDDTVRRITSGQDPETIMKSLEPGLKQFAEVRKRYLIYK